MSTHGVVREYLEGQIDRREFVQRLMAVGVSAAAAAAYAHTLSQPALARAAGRDARGYLNAAYQDNYPVLDTDDDGFTDEEEEECGSDPDDPNSTCDNVGEGTPCNQTVTFVFVGNLTINLPGGATFVINSGAQFVFSSGSASSGGCTSTSWSFSGSINGQNASFTFSATLRIAGSAAGAAGVRAFAAQQEIVFEINDVIAWNVTGVPTPEVPVEFVILSTGGTLGIDVGGAQTAAAITPNLEVPFRSVTRYEISPLSELPDTGTGPTVAANSRWLAPVAVAGAGAALLARGLRRFGRTG